MSKLTNAKDCLFTLPTRLRMEELTEDTTGTFHFNLEGDGGGEFTVSLENKNVKVEEGLNGVPDCVIRASAKDYYEVETGKQNAQMAVLMGKIKISDLGQMMKFMGLFNKIEE